MKLFASTALIALATLFIGFASVAWLVAPPSAFDSRGLLIVAVATAGCVFAALAGREVRRINRQLSLSAR